MRCRQPLLPSCRPPLVAIFVCAAYACGSRPPSKEGTDSAIQSAVLLTFDSLTQAIRSLNVDQMLTFYSTDSGIVRAIDGRVISGRRAVEQDFREGFGAVRAIDRIDVRARHLAVLGPESAVLTAELDEAFTDTARRVTKVRATWTSAWKLQMGQWRIIQDAAVHVPTGP